MEEKIEVVGLSYEQMNAKTVTSLRFVFQLPRDIYPNEEIKFRLGIDLESSNLGNERMLLSIYDSSDN